MSELLFWTDIETTGLIPTKCHLLEVAVVVADAVTLDIRATCSVTIHPLPSCRAQFDVDRWVDSLQHFGHIAPNVVEMHRASGLLRCLAEFGVSRDEAESNLISFLEPYKEQLAQSPMCGASIHFDRSFLQVHMPQLEAMFHYRNFDVSTLRKAFELWGGLVHLEVQQQKKHRALPDTYDAINLAKVFKKMIERKGRLMCGESFL